MVDTTGELHHAATRAERLHGPTPAYRQLNLSSCQGPLVPMQLRLVVPHRRLAVPFICGASLPTYLNKHRVVPVRAFTQLAAVFTLSIVNKVHARSNSCNMANTAERKEYYRDDGVRIVHDPYAPGMVEKYGRPGDTDNEVRQLPSAA
jgi:hypothetical protein